MYDCNNIGEGSTLPHMTLETLKKILTGTVAQVNTDYHHP